MTQPAADYMMRGFLCVTDDAGQEVAGSRRNLKNVRTTADYESIWHSLERRMAEGCQVVHSDRLVLPEP